MLDWMMFARQEWEVYEDPERLHKYVEFGKITEEQYEMIIKEG